jgi:hypothetical protein
LHNQRYSFNYSFHQNKENEKKRWEKSPSHQLLRKNKERTFEKGRMVFCYQNCSSDREKLLKLEAVIKAADTLLHARMHKTLK